MPKVTSSSPPPNRSWGPGRPAGQAAALASGGSGRGKGRSGNKRAGGVSALPTRAGVREVVVDNNNGSGEAVDVGVAADEAAALQDRVDELQKLVRRYPELEPSLQKARAELDELRKQRPLSQQARSLEARLRRKQQQRDKRAAAVLEQEAQLLELAKELSASRARLLELDAELGAMRTELEALPKSSGVAPVDPSSLEVVRQLLDALGSAHVDGPLQELGKKAREAVDALAQPKATEPPPAARQQANPPDAEMAAEPTGSGDNASTSGGDQLDWAAEINAMDGLDEQLKGELLGKLRARQAEIESTEAIKKQRVG